MNQAASLLLSITVLTFMTSCSLEKSRTVTGLDDNNEWKTRDTSHVKTIGGGRSHAGGQSYKDSSGNPSGGRYKGDFSWDF